MLTPSTYSFIHTASVPSTLPDLSMALYACFASSVKASTPTPAVPAAATRAAVLRCLGLGVFLPIVEYDSDGCGFRI